VSIGDGSVVEGNSGTATANFTLSLSAGSPDVVRVRVASADGTAGAPADYAALDSTVEIPPGVTAYPVSVEVKGDTVDEPDETFAIALSDPSRATIADGQALGTILDDDAPPPTSNPGSGQQQEHVAEIPDSDPPAATLAAAHVLNLKKLLKGFSFTIGCDEQCTIDARLQAPAGALRKLVGARAAKTIATGHSRLAAAGRLALKVKPSKRWVKQLRHLKKSLKLTLVITVRDGAGNTRTLKKPVTLRR
jgi:hypothetical protein